MADHEARRYLGRPITNLIYRWDHFGPNDPEIFRQIKILKQNDIIYEEAFPVGDGYTGFQYLPTSKEVPCPLRKEEEAILEYIIKQYAKMNLIDFLDDVVYQTRPMSAATWKGELLKMELVDNEERIPGLELEHVLESDQELRSGGGTSFEDLLAEAKDEEWAKTIESRYRSIREAE